ncbi:MAG: hypothetical protein DDT29_01626 [Dehalococcoidia bacterium]|nr:hypothetical protein [Bacillota bacterium]
MVSHPSQSNRVAVGSGHDRAIEVRDSFNEDVVYKQGIGRQGKEYGKDNEGIAGEILGSWRSAQKVVQRRARGGKACRKKEKGGDNGAVEYSIYPQVKDEFGKDPKEKGRDEGKAREDNQPSLPYPSMVVDVKEKTNKGEREKAKQRDRISLQ